MFPFLASALLSLRRQPLDQPVGPLDAGSPASEPRRHLSLVPPVSVPVPPAVAIPITMSNGGPSPISRALDAMLTVLKRFVQPPLMPLPPPPPLPPATVLLASVVERTVGLGSRVGTDLRGPFSVAAIKGLRVEGVVRFEVWGHTPSEVGQAVEDLIKHLLEDPEGLRASGFLRAALKSNGLSENIFAEDAWRQSVEFDVLFEFPYIDSDDADSIIARIPIDFIGEFNESTLVVDEMARWDNELAPALQLRGPLSIGALSTLAFIPANEPTGTVNITDDALAGMEADGIPQTVLTALALEGTKDKEVGGEDAFVAFLESKIAVPDTTAHKAVILKHAATSKPVAMGDWDENGIPDEYQSLQFRVKPSIKLAGVTDRFEITYQDPNFDNVAILYLRAASGLTT